MNKHAVDLYRYLAVIKRNRHVIIGKTDIGKVCKNRFTAGRWVAYKPNGQRAFPEDAEVTDFRTRREAVRALIEASEELLTKEHPIEI